MKRTAAASGPAADPASAIRSIWVDEKVLDYPLTRRVLRNAGPIPVEMLSSGAAQARMAGLSPQEGKRTLFLTRHAGAGVKSCPGTSDPYLCCGYRVINQMGQCPMDCTYCIMQGYLDSPCILLNVNLEDMFGEIRRQAAENPDRILRFGTGETGDSLALDSLTEASADWIEFFSGLPNTIIELKTKSVRIENLPGLKSKNTVLAWSLNPGEIASHEERRAPAVPQRIEAAGRCMEAGYKLAFHFDPILSFPGWQDRYLDLVDGLFHKIDAGRIAWISLGTLRFPPHLQGIIRRRFPKSRILDEEMIRGLDGKMRYPRPMRTAMYRLVADRIRLHSRDVFLYFCMEHPAVWESVLGSAPASNDELDSWFTRSLSERFGSFDAGGHP
jgi:spore photoproduct lyase